MFYYEYVLFVYLSSKTCFMIVAHPSLLMTIVKETVLENCRFGIREKADEDCQM